MKACFVLAACCAAFAEDCPSSSNQHSLVHEAATAFQQIETLQNVAHQLRAAGVNDLAQAATERADHVKQNFLARLEADQQELHAFRQQQPGIAIVHCQMIEIQTDRVPDELARGGALLSGTEAQECRKQIAHLVACGAAKIIAEPRIQTRSGNTARFVSGGESPIPAPDSNSGADSNLQEFGVKFEATPERQQDGRWHVAFSLEAAVPNPDAAVQLAGFKIPGLLKRRVASTVTIADGQTLALTGLNTVDKQYVVLMSVESPAPSPMGEVFSSPAEAEAIKAQGRGRIEFSVPRPIFPHYWPVRVQIAPLATPGLPPAPVPELP